MLSKKDYDDSWEAIEGHISKRKQQRRNQFVAGSAMATAAIFLLIFNIYSPMTLNRRSGDEQTNVVLQDDSRIYLNKNSTLIYPKSFEDTTERRVSLEGEAFFEVERDEKVPFKIIVDEAEVQVLGTSFNVRSRESENQIEVFVKTGKVEFGKGNKTVVLTPNEMGIYDKASEAVVKKTLTDSNSLAWHSKKMVFDKSRFIEIEKTLYKVFGYQMKVDNPNIYNCALTSTIEFETIEDALQILEATIGATFVLDGDKILVSGDGC